MEIEKTLEKAKERAKKLWSELYDYFYNREDREITWFLKLYRDYSYLKDHIEQIDINKYQLEEELYNE